MNVKLLAACVLLVQSGALLVSDNYKFVYALQTLKDLELGWLYASWYWKVSNVKPTQSCSAPVASQFVSVQFVLQRVLRHLRSCCNRTKACRRLVILNYATYIISQPVFALTRKNRFISIKKNIWSPYKNSKTTRNSYLGLDLSIHVKNGSVWWCSPFKWDNILRSL